MNIEIETVKGFRDYLPPESLKRKAVLEIIENNFKLYGFFPVETPIIEFDELMKPDSISEEEDEAVSERFRLKDRAGRNLGLRYEFTFQLSRIFKLNPNIKLPFKRYQIGPVFRDEPISSDRFRQFIQCDADIIGNPSIDSDAECLFLVSDIMKELKIPAEIQLNNRKLLTSIIESVQIKNAKQVMREIDKIAKIGEDKVKSNLKKYADSNQILTLFKLLGKDISFFEENLFEGAEELLNLQRECKKYGIKTKINLFMIRGLGYYTGNIFEVILENKDSLAAGGRYDNSIGKFINQKIPAVGISFGLDRLALLANIKPKPISKAIIIPIEEEKAALMIAKKLRKENISCIISNEKVSKSLEYANYYSIPYAILIGNDELAQNKYKLKNMTSGEEKLVSEKQLINTLS